MYIQLNSLVNLILASYLYNARCILYFTDNNQFTYFGNLPIVQILVNDSVYDKLIIFTKFHGCQGILINTQNPSQMFSQIEQDIRSAIDRFNERKVIFIPQNSHKSTYMHVFRNPSIEFVADLLVIVPKNNSEISDEDANMTLFKTVEETVNFEMYTHRYSGDDMEVVHLDTWDGESETFLNDSNLFPNKIHDQLGKSLKIATFTYKPYSVPETKEGTEMELALEYAYRFNMTPQLVVDEVGEWGEIYDNWTGYGILGNILYDNADIGLGALYTWSHEHAFLDLSKPVVRTGITCIAPKPILAGGLIIPFVSFSLYLWIAVGIAFLVCSAAVFCLDFYNARVLFAKAEIPARHRTIREIFGDSVMQTASVFLLQALSVSKEQRDKAGKYLFSCMFILTIVVSTSYSGGLASSMTVPRYTGAIKTVQDLVDSGIQWGATSIAWIMSIMDAKDEPNYVTLVNRFVKTTADVLIKYNNKRFAYSVERLPAGYFAIGSYVTEKGVQDLRLMNEDLYWEQCVIMTRKSSILLPTLDMLILKIQESGISRTWEFRVATKHLNAKVQEAVKYSSHHTDIDETDPMQLKWMHVEGAFSLWILGISVSIIAFLKEVRDRLKSHKQTVLSPLTTKNNEFSN